MNLNAWGTISLHAVARGRQTYYCHAESVPVPSGRFLITWDTDGDGSEVYWAGGGQGYDGQGWTDDRREALEYLTRDHAAEDLRAARRSIDDGRARWVEITEVA